MVGALRLVIIMHLGAHCWPILSWGWFNKTHKFWYYSIDVIKKCCRLSGQILVGLLFLNFRICPVHWLVAAQWRSPNQVMLFTVWIHNPNIGLNLVRNSDSVWMTDNKVWSFNHHSNTGPFDIQTMFYYSNTGQVWLDQVRLGIIMFMYQLD